MAPPPPSSPAPAIVAASEPDVLIDFRPNTRCCAAVHLRSLHPSHPVFFKVQTSAPYRFLVSPPRGALAPPRAAASLRVVLRPQPHPPPDFPRSRSDRFLILASLSDADLDKSSASSSASATAIRLRVFYGGPYLLRIAAAAGDATAVRLILRRQPHLLPLLHGGPELAAADEAVAVHAAMAAAEEGDVDARVAEEGRTALHVAAMEGDAEAAAVLVDAGADTAAVDAFGRTPADIARDNGNQEVLEIVERWEQVLTAARRGELRRLEQLLKKKRCVHGRDQYGLTALHCAAVRDDRDALAMLLAAAPPGVDVDVEDDEGHTPLHLAVEGGCAGAAELLLDMGANVNAMTRRGATPLQMAVALGHDGVAKLLRGRGAAAPLAASPATASSSPSCDELS